MNRALRGYCLQTKTVGAWAERLVLYVCACIIGYSDSLAANGVGVRGKCSRARSVLLHHPQEPKVCLPRERA
jgi:hypothetical protein